MKKSMKEMKEIKEPVWVGAWTAVDQNTMFRQFLYPGIDVWVLRRVYLTKTTVETWSFTIGHGYDEIYVPGHDGYTLEGAQEACTKGIIESWNKRKS